MPLTASGTWTMTRSGHITTGTWTIKSIEPDQSEAARIALLLEQSGLHHIYGVIPFELLDKTFVSLVGRTDDLGGSGEVNHGGAYGVISRKYSKRQEVEADHVPACSSTTATTYDIGRDLLPAVSVEYYFHRYLGGLFGTTGSGYLPKALREAIRRFLEKREFFTAEQFNIITMYGYWGKIPTYFNGLVELLRYAQTCRQRNGSEFMTDGEVSRLITWLGEMRDLTTSCGNDRFKLFEKIAPIIVKLLRQAGPLDPDKLPQ
ncbi:uncharacterized protein LOC144442829 [Glandiceps talaboti]